MFNSVPMMNPVIFREYDIRGVVDKDFDASFAEDLGRAFATMVGRHFKTKPNLTVAHDARNSGPVLTDAVVRGMRMAGANVTHLGLVTTPLSYYSTFALDGINGAIMITGSHNPPEYNGFKLSRGQSTIFGADIQELKRMIDAKDFDSGEGTFRHHDIRPHYIARYKKEFEGMRPIPVVLDCGNGTAGCVVGDLFKAIGLQPTILFEKPDGTFPNHHPDPTVAENLTDLIAEVKKTGAACGIGFDGDTDRIGIVDDTGEIILGDEFMVLVARDILTRTPGATIVGDVKCSDRFYADVEKHGGKAIMWKTGHSLVKEKIKVEKAPFGGELSGHIFFADRNYGYDDAIYAGLRLIEILSRTGKKISELLADLPKASNTPEIRIDTTEEKKTAIVTAIRKAFEKPSNEYSVNLIDGIRIRFQDGWALVRSSNTQPVVVLRFEGNTLAAKERIQKQVEKLVLPLL